MIERSSWDLFQSSKNKGFVKKISFGLYLRDELTDLHKTLLKDKVGSTES